MKFLSENWFKAGILGIFLMVAYPIYNYYSNYLPERDAQIKKEQSDKEFQQAVDKTNNANKLQTCLNLADINYNELFTADCKLERNLNCDTSPTLSVSTIKGLQSDRDNAKEFCFKQYPQN